MRRFSTPLFIAAWISIACLVVPVIAQNAARFSLVRVSDGSASAPSYSFASNTDTGDWLTGSTIVRTINAAPIYGWASTAYRINSGAALEWSTDVGSAGDVALSRGAANRLDLASGDGFNLVSGAITFGGTTSASPSLVRSGTALLAQLADGSAQAAMAALAFYPQSATITAGSGTGFTVASQGITQRVVYKAVVDRTAFVAAATTADFTIATLPAKTRLLTVDGELTTTFLCTATCTSSTLSMVLGRTAGGAQYLASMDVDAATAWFGDADSELGTELVRSAAVQGGTLPNPSGTTNVILRLTSGTGNIGNGTVTNLSQGSITIYLVTERLP